MGKVFSFDGWITVVGAVASEARRPSANQDRYR
jgi:hypothetical protein